MHGSRGIINRQVSASLPGRRLRQTFFRCSRSGIAYFALHYVL